jgi:hypothetical protein
MDNAPFRRVLVFTTCVWRRVEPSGEQGDDHFMRTPVAPLLVGLALVSCGGGEDAASGGGGGAEDAASGGGEDAASGGGEDAASGGDGTRPVDAHSPPPDSYYGPDAPQPHDVTDFTTSGESVGRYEKYEISFAISRAFAADSLLPYYPYDASDTPAASPGRNAPYGQDGITIDAHLHSPSGSDLVVPAFYLQKYQRVLNGGTETLTATTELSWNVRFAPEETGTYSYFISIEDKSGTTHWPPGPPRTFVSTVSSSKGFVRVSPRDKRFMQYDNGESFVPISSAHQWWKDIGLRSYDTTNAFDDFGAHGINLVRVWDQNDGYKLTVEGHFDAYGTGNSNPADNAVPGIPKGTQPNQRGNAEQDAIIESAEKNGIAIELCSHGDAAWIWDASTYTDAWNANVIAFDDPRHLAYFERNFRYRVARWGYSTSILAWETWNEHGHVVSTDPTYKFYQAYGDYQRKTDPYRHLRTTSQGSQAFSPGLWSSGAMDIANYHDYMMSNRYPAGLYDDEVKFVYSFAQCLRTPTGAGGGCSLGIGDGSTWTGDPKPFIWGECDTGTTQWNEANPQPIADHNILWAGLFSPLGTHPIDWYFESKDSYIQQKYDWAKIARDFFTGVDYAGLGFVYLATSDVAVTSQTASASDPGMRVLAMRAADGKSAYAWVQNKQYRWGTGTTSPSPISGMVTIPGMTASAYTIEIWSTHDGTKTTASATVGGGSVTVTVSGLSQDVAIKIIGS